MLQHPPLWREDEEDMEELSFVPSAVRDPRWALHMCDNRCREKRLQVLLCQKEVHTINLCKKCYNERRLKQGEAGSGGFKMEGAHRAEAFSRKVVGSCWIGTILASNVGTFHHLKSVGQIRLGRGRKCEAIGNGRQTATRDAVQGGARACAAQQ